MRNVNIILENLFTNNYLLFYLLIYYYDCYHLVLYQNLEKNNVSNVPKGTYFINC